MGESITMNTRQKRTFCIVGVLLIGCFMAGCEEQTRTLKTSNRLLPKTELGTTVGSLVEVFSFFEFPVEGYALVGGLRHTGSPKCPPKVRKYLKKYIRTQLPEYKNVGHFINSYNTATVVVRGFIPAAASKGERFDLKVVTLQGTQTTSLEGGQLWGAELFVAGKFGLGTKALANAEGPIFIDTINDFKTNKNLGYILGGGIVIDDYRINLLLHQPDFKTASNIRNRIIERFGDDVAKAILESQIKLKVPTEYLNQKERFIALVKATYLTASPEITRHRISTHIRKLATSQNKEQNEIALEAIGTESLGKLAILLNSSKEQVQLRAARCMLNLGSDRGLPTLRKIAMHKGSPYRIEAMEAIGKAGSEDAAAISRTLLRDEDFDIRFTAYKQLRNLDDISIIRQLVAGVFYLERIAQTGRPAIFVSRSGRPRIVLFGAPIYCREDIFVQSADGNITINASAGQKHVSIIRKHPNPERSATVLRLQSTHELSDIIRTLAEAPLKKGGTAHQGLNVSYADVIALLQQMCQKGVVQAEFHVGPLPKIH